MVPHCPPLSPVPKLIGLVAAAVSPRPGVTEVPASCAVVGCIGLIGSGGGTSPGLVHEVDEAAGAAAP